VVLLTAPVMLVQYLLEWGGRLQLVPNTIPIVTLIIHEKEERMSRMRKTVVDFNRVKKVFHFNLQLADVIE